MVTIAIVNVAAVVVDTPTVSKGCRRVAARLSEGVAMVVRLEISLIVIYEILSAMICTAGKGIFVFLSIFLRVHYRDRDFSFGF